MRQPSDPEQALAWWRDAIAGKNPQITHEPHAGFFKRKLVKDGPWVGARIWLEQRTDPETGELVDDEHLACRVNGERRNAEEQWTYLGGQPITEEEYRYLRDTHRWAAHRAPEEPHANPDQPVDHLKTPLPF